MIITNKHNLPEPLYRAIARDVQPREGFSITDLIQPPRMTQLSRRHWDEIEEDASDRIWLVLGSSVHYILAHSMQGACTEPAPLRKVGVPYRIDCGTKSVDTCGVLAHQEGGT